MKKTLLYLFACALLGSFSSGCFRTSIQDKQEKEIDSLINILINERWEWNQASENLIQIGSPASTPLIKALQNKELDQWQRKKAAITLKMISTPTKVEPCMNIFQDITEDMAIRASACNALSGEDIDEYEELFLDLAKNASGTIQNCAFNRLSEINSEEGTKILIEAARTATETRQWLLIHCLENNQSPEVDIIFADILLQQTWWQINEFIAQSLVVRGERIVGLMKSIIENDENPEFSRWRAVWILKEIDFPNKEDYFNELLKNKSWVIRNEAEVFITNN